MGVPALGGRGGKPALGGTGHVPPLGGIASTPGASNVMDPGNPADTLPRNQGLITWDCRHDRYELGADGKYHSIQACTLWWNSLFLTVPIGEAERDGGVVSGTHCGLITPDERETDQPPLSRRF